MEKGEDSKGDLWKLEGDVRRQRATRQAFKIEAKDIYDVTWAGLTPCGRDDLHKQVAQMEGAVKGLEDQLEEVQDEGTRSPLLDS